MRSFVCLLAIVLSASITYPAFAQTPRKVAFLVGACGNCQKLLSDMMRTLRDLQNQVPVTVGACGTVKVGRYSVSPDEVNRALASKLASWKSQSETLAEQEKSVERQRAASQMLAARYGDWNQKRELLAQRLETLRARLAAHNAGSTISESSIDTTDVVRATQLADEIERRLRVVEKQEALGTDPFEHLLSDTRPTGANVENEVDRILNKKLSRQRRANGGRQPLRGGRTHPVSPTRQAWKPSERSTSHSSAYPLKVTTGERTPHPVHTIWLPPLAPPALGVQGFHGFC